VTALARLSREQTEASPGAIGLVLDQLGHALLQLWRSRITLVFTFVLPLVWLVMVGLLAGNEVVDPNTGVRVMQLVTPLAAVLGMVFAAYPPIATSLALAREQRVIKRLRGTPLPVWAYLLGQVGAAIILAGAALVVMLAIGVLAYDVQIQWRTAIATLATLAVGVGCLASLGLAVGALAPSSATAQAVAMASAVLVAFASGLFKVGGNEPAWMAPIGHIFPIRNIGDPLSDQFNPYLTGNGWDLGALAVLVAWGIAGLAVATWALRREPRVAAHGIRHGTEASTGTTTPEASLVATVRDRPPVLALIGSQARAALVSASRNPSLAFFAVAMPVGLYALVCSMYEGNDALLHGLPFGAWFAAGMTAYGVGVVGFVSIPGDIAAARDRGALKRVRGTPLPPWVYLAGKAAAVVVLSLLLGVLMLTVGTLAFHVDVALEAVPAALGVLLLGALTMAACGFALIAVAPSAKAASVLSLLVLLPLSFLSEVFVVGDLPDPIPTFADLFPLKHLVLAIAATLDPAGWSFAWPDLAVVAAWLAGAAFVAVRMFRWDPISGGAARGERARGASRRDSGSATDAGPSQPER